MTTTQLPHPDPRATDGRAAPAVRRRGAALPPLLAGGLLVGVGLGLLVDGLAWSLVAAAGLTAVGAGLLVRTAHGSAAGALAGSISGLLIVTGAAALAIASVGGVRDGLRGLPWAGDDVWVAGEHPAPTSTVTIEQTVAAVVADLDRGTVVVRETDAAGT